MIEAILLIAIAYLIYLPIRNEMVFKFRMELIGIDHKYGTNLHSKYAYNQMLFSFKRLKLTSWFTEEELKDVKE